MGMRVYSANAAISASRCCGSRRSFFRQTLAISKPSKAGAKRLLRSSRAATASASGSPNSKAAKAEASTTLTAIPIGADDRCGFGRGLKPKLPDFRKDLLGRQPARPADCLFDDCQQLTLQRAMMLCRTLSQAFDDIVGGVLDREVDGHPNRLQFGGTK